MMKSLSFSIVGLSFLILCLPKVASACGGISPPRFINLSGSSYSETVTLKLETRCDILKGLIIPRSENADEASAEDSIARFAMTKQHSTCAALGTDDCVDEAEVVVRHNNRAIAVIKTTSTEAFLYSVNKQGKKDESKPYMKFTKGELAGRPTRARLVGENTLGSVSIRAYNNNEQIGEMSISGGACGLRGGGGAAAQSGELDLNGKRFVSTAGCGGSSLTESAFESDTDETSDTDNSSDEE